MESNLIDDGYLDLDSKSNLYGSNAILMLGKKKKKEKKEQSRGLSNVKGSKKNKGRVKEAPDSLSKNQQKKLQKLQEEKEKKLRQLESIELLKKYKLQDNAYSLLQSSGTIGQVVTRKEKRSRAVQLSKAGLQVPEDGSLFRKKRKSDTSSDDEGNINLDSGQSHLEIICRDDLKRTGSVSVDDRNSNRDSGVNVVSVNKTLQDVNVRSNDVTLPVEVMDKDITCVPIDQKDMPSIARCNYGHAANVQDVGSDFSKENCQDSKFPVDHTVQKHVNTPVVVHVFRPTEIEQKRKDLPIIMMEQEIMEAINEHSIVLLRG